MQRYLVVIWFPLLWCKVARHQVCNDRILNVICKNCIRSWNWDSGFYEMSSQLSQRYFVIDMNLHRPISSCWWKCWCVWLCHRKCQLYSKTICISINLLWPVGAAWQLGPRLALALVVACWLMSPGHCLTQCWSFLSGVLCLSLKLAS